MNFEGIEYAESTCICDLSSLVINYFLDKFEQLLLLELLF